MAKWLREFWLKLKANWIKKMIIKARQKYTRQTARKVRYVADVVKEMSIEDALKQLAVMERRASLVVLKTLRQAIANAINNQQLTLDQLKIKNIVVDEAPTYKRWRAVSRGRAHTILKRSCHVEVQLETKETDVKNEKVEQKIKKEKSKETNKKPTKAKVNKTSTAKKKTNKKITKKDNK
ncbi:MAG: 50S ribosomal protein L22 [Candidatus Pacebacteria bacterium]|jgi:large subunit ribosomal protein L22|nr:50S ribosomal protein L22 [Candidatus Paceibacterota bacterium]